MIKILVVYKKGHDVVEEMKERLRFYDYRMTISKEVITVTIPKDISVIIDFVCETDFGFKVRYRRYHYIHVEHDVEIDEEVLYTIKRDFVSDLIDGRFKLI